jgi:hypothetical protein
MKSLLATTFLFVDFRDVKKGPKPVSLIELREGAGSTILYSGAD